MLERSDLVSFRLSYVLFGDFLGYYMSFNYIKLSCLDELHIVRSCISNLMGMDSIAIDTSTNDIIVLETD